VARDDDRLGGAVTRAEHEIIAVEIELFDRDGEEGQVMAVQTAGKWQVLNRRCVHAPPFDDRIGRARDTDERKEVGRGEQLTESQ
jgi:hypothetical protein